MKKSQAALEFLTTYAWAFLVILITIAALYYFGIFDFDRYLPQKCTFSSQFKCIDFSMKDSDIKFRLLNDIGEEINVTSLIITNDATPPLNCTSPTNLDSWDDDEERDFVFTSCHDGTFIKGERTDAEITLNYYAFNTPSQPIHHVKGKITGIVE